MITYEKAFELKEAGFPQPEMPTEGNYSTWTLHHTHGEAYSSGFNNDKEPVLIHLFPGHTYARELVYKPTLSELIEACGPKFWALEWVTNKKWVAHSFASTLSVQSNPGRSIGGIRASDPDADTAAANLYLAIHNQNKAYDDQPEKK